jgi:hypothetical protein
MRIFVFFFSVLVFVFFAIKWSLMDDQEREQREQREDSSNDPPPSQSKVRRTVERRVCRTHTPPPATRASCPTVHRSHMIFCLDLRAWSCAAHAPHKCAPRGVCPRGDPMNCSLFACVHPRVVVRPRCLQLRQFVSLFTGEYIYKKLKWEWRTCDSADCEGEKLD